MSRPALGGACGLPVAWPHDARAVMGEERPGQPPGLFAARGPNFFNLQRTDCGIKCAMTNKKPAYKPRLPLPMPVEMVLDAKGLKFAPGSVHRAVISICCQFWAGGAVLDAFDESVAQQVARIPAGHWAAIKSPVMAALDEILPKLAATYAGAQAHRAALRETMRQNGRKGALAIQAFNERRALAVRMKNAKSGGQPSPPAQAATEHAPLERLPGRFPKHYPEGKRSGRNVLLPDNVDVRFLDK